VEVSRSTGWKDHHVGHVFPPSDPTFGFSQPGDLLLAMLERIGLGYVVLDKDQRVETVRWNKNSLSPLDSGESEHKNWSHEVFQSAIRFIGRSIEAKMSAGIDHYAEISTARGRPILLFQIADIGADGRVILAALDLNEQLQPKPDVLRRMFGLTAAEIKLALKIANGASPNEIAHDLNLCRTTIRSQLASVFEKTGTRRQAQLVALLSRVALLP